MLELFLNIVFVALVIVALFVLYFQIQVYQQQKELINKESKALKILRNKNMESLRSRFFLKRVKVKA